MASTNLRDYLAAIEQLIDSNQIEDALAHCRHVLKSHPKNIATYRLMGKAYLESKRHSEATDLFQRVLSSIPDDFVSHIGMSIIREDESNLDAAIWHMERAFESQPSNKAVQGEVRRLYGLREGYEPPKVRLTRGALARMYSHGDLYNQAIGELRNALTEDPQRPDLQVLLAEMHFKNNQPAEASAVCSQIIQKLPYCLYANRVMADILRNNQQDVDAMPYWQRVEELDPYAAQVSTLKDVEQVPADSVMIDTLEMDSAMLLGAPAAPEDDLDFEKEELPDWLSVDDNDAIPEAEAAGEESLMSSLEGLEPLGQDPSVDAFEAAPSDPLDPNTPFRTGALQPDEIPDWLRELRPGTTPPAAGLPADGLAPGKRWTEEFKQAGFNPTGPLDLGEGQEEYAEEDAPIAADPVAQAPDENSPEPTSRPTGWLPTGELRWLDTAFTEDENAEASAEAETPQAETERELPEWLAELNEQELAHTQPTRPTTSAFVESPAFIEADEAAADELPDEQLEAGEDEPNWLGELQAEAGMREDSDTELPRTDELHDAESTQRLDALGWEQQPEPLAPETPAELEDQPSPEATPPTDAATSEEDENLSWLEGLAARRGASEDELLTDPQQRSTAKPDWLQAEQATEAASEQPSSELTPLSEDLTWLDELAAASGSVSAATHEEDDNVVHSAADEALGLSEDSPFSQQDESELSLSGEAEDTTPGWLQHFTGSLPTQPEEPIAPRPLEEAPDWLSELRPQDTDSLTAPAPAAEDAAPAWPSLEPDEPATASEPDTPAIPASEDDTPEWLRQLAQAHDAPYEQTASNNAAWDAISSTEEAQVEDREPAQVADDDWAFHSEATAVAEAAEPAPGAHGDEGESTEAGADWEASTAEVESEDEDSPPAPAIEPRWVPARQIPASENALAADEPSEPELTTEPQHVAEPEPAWESEPIAETEPEVEAEPAWQPETIAETELETESEPAWQPEPIVETAPEVEAEPAQQPDPITETEPEVEAEPERQPEPIAKTEPQAEPQLAAPQALASQSELAAAAPQRKRARGLSPEEIEDRLAGARQALSYGNLGDAAEAYSYFLRRRIRLDDIIADLRAASRRFPRQVAVWQTLGDAYMRNNQLTEALDCYTRAKSLL